MRPVLGFYRSAAAAREAAADGHSPYFCRSHRVWHVAAPDEVPTSCAIKYTNRERFVRRLGAMPRGVCRECGADVVLNSEGVVARFHEPCPGVLRFPGHGVMVEGELVLCDREHGYPTCEDPRCWKGPLEPAPRDPNRVPSRDGWDGGQLRGPQ